MLYLDHNDKANIHEGIQIDEPVMFIPWNTDEETFKEVFKHKNMHCVADKYYSIRGATIFGEGYCNIGITFENTIREVSISREHYDGLDDYVKSFLAYQTSLARRFGEPHKCKQMPNGFAHYEWYFGNSIIIRHYVMERFCLEEHLRIERIK